tara:strand:+ start:7120 stop:7836 length:717 start_codon:yes stop_codon:yes gene_type:complete
VHKLFILPLLLLTLACQAHDDPNRRLISTNGFGEIKVKPDIAIVNLSVRATHTSGKAAKKDVDDRVNNFLDALKNMKVKQEDIIASTIRLNPRYEHLSGTRRFTGYEATRTLSVTLHDMTKLTGVMDQSLEQRLEGIDNIRYDNSKMDEHIHSAHLLAISDSKVKAAALAKAYGAELGPIVRIDYHRNTPIYQGMAKEASMADAQMMRAAPSRPGTYLPDQITYSDNIQVQFDLIINP